MAIYKLQSIFMFDSQVYMHSLYFITLFLLPYCLSQYNGKTRKHFHKYKIYYFMSKNRDDLLFALSVFHLYIFTNLLYPFDQLLVASINMIMIVWDFISLSLLIRL